jgi:glyoxylate utilization-related uncharacterized protein
MESLIVTIQPNGASGSKQDARQAERLPVIFKGSLELRLERKIRNLKRGDAPGFLPARGSWRNRNKRPA